MELGNRHAQQRRGGRPGRLRWDGSSPTFSWSDYLDHVGSRGKDAPAFDAFDLSAGENNEFGVDTTEARHFTDYSLANDTSGTGGTSLDSDIPGKLEMMNPMYFIPQPSAGGTRSRRRPGGGPGTPGIGRSF
ncbi:hypothetical protein ACWCQR_46295, partial [Streptomyces sp. NPDC002172]